MYLFFFVIALVLREKLPFFILKLGTLKDENVGMEAIADYVLFKLNQNSIFDYVEQLELDQPYDDVKEMLTNFAIKKNMYRTLSRKFTGKGNQIQTYVAQP